MYLPSRRQLLKIAGKTLIGTGAASALGRLSVMDAYAQGTEYRALVCLFLFGGNDSNNMVISVATTKNSYTDYSNIRKAVAIAQGSLLPFSSGSDSYGFHPSMTAIHGMYGTGNVAVVSN